jgi:hypothetical protein
MPVTNENICKILNAENTTITEKILPLSKIRKPHVINKIALNTTLDHINKIHFI